MVPMVRGSRGKQIKQRRSGKSRGILKVPECKNKRQMKNLFKVIKTCPFIVIKINYSCQVFNACHPYAVTVRICLVPAIVQAEVDKLSKDIDAQKLVLQQM